MKQVYASWVWKGWTFASGVWSGTGVEPVVPPYIGQTEAGTYARSGTTTATMRRKTEPAVQYNRQVPDSSGFRRL